MSATIHSHTCKKTEETVKPKSLSNKNPCPQMVCQESDIGSAQCEKHYSHGHQQQGICPACLRDKLLYVASTIQSCTSSCSSSPSSSSPRPPPPPYSPTFSTSSSAYASPPHRRRASDVAFSIGFIMGAGGNNGLSKSRSVAFAVNNDAGGRKKKGGFWSKLLRLPGKRRKDDTFGHSRNLKEGFQYYNY